MESEVKSPTPVKEDGCSIDHGLVHPTIPRPALLQHLSDEELVTLEKKLRRKIDMRLLPIMILIYVMNYLDR